MDTRMNKRWTVQRMEERIHKRINYSWIGGRTRNLLKGKINDGLKNGPQNGPQNGPENKTEK
jgi:hypothetical protein